jgi:hypothetical protein
VGPKGLQPPGDRLQAERPGAPRVLVSAADASKAWDLRCHVREQMIAFVQRQFPESLPRMRAEIDRQTAR